MTDHAPPHPLEIARIGAGAPIDKIKLHKERRSRPHFVVMCCVMCKALLIASVIMVCIGILGCDSGNTSQSTPSQRDSLGRQVPAWVHDDADLLVYRCGQPDRVLDTSEDDPRPLISSRILTYRKAHLKIAYLPSDSADQPPPYHWKLMGVIDTRNNTAVRASDLHNTLQRRLPCMLNNPK
jgi:hypothetical protein